MRHTGKGFILTGRERTVASTGGLKWDDGFGVWTVGLRHLL